MDLSYLVNPNLPDIKDTYRIGKAEIEIRQAGKHYLYLSANPSSMISGVSQMQISNFPNQSENVLFRRWKITVFNELGKPIQLSILPFSAISHVYPNGQFVSIFKLVEVEIGFAAANKRRIFTSLEPGIGSQNIVTVPELDGIHKDLAIEINLTEAPTTGKLYVCVEAQK